MLSIDFDICDIVFEYSGHVDLSTSVTMHKGGIVAITSGKVPLEKTLYAEISIVG